MQVEAKFSVSNAATFETILEVIPHALGPVQRVLAQRCLFLDGPHGELARVNAVCRVRSEVDSSHDPQAKSPSKQSPSTVVIKEHNEVEDGSSARFVVESKMPPGAAFLDPIEIEGLIKKTTVGDAIANRFGPLDLTVVGGFDNTRHVFYWRPDANTAELKVQLDRTTYPFGEGFEIEVPCDASHCVEDLISGLHELLVSLGVPEEHISLGSRSKFQTYSEGMARMNSSATTHMTMEAKVTIRDCAAYERVLARLIHNHVKTDVQHNYFFVGAQGELSNEGAYLRLRQTGANAYSVTIKQHSEVDSGSGISWQQEDVVGSDVAEAIIARGDANPLVQLRTSTVAEALVHRFGIPSDQAWLRSIGSFTTRRSVFKWPEARAVQSGLEIRVDETTYPNDVMRYEIEVANVSVPICDVLDMLQAALMEYGIESEPSNDSKVTQMLRLTGALA